MVANRQPQPKQGTVQDLINGLLDRGYNREVQPVLRAVAKSVNSGLIQTRLDQLDKEAQRLIDSGEKLTPDNPVLRALLADLDSTMKTNASVVNGAAEAVQQTGINAAATIQRQLALPGMTDTPLARIGVVRNRPDPAAVARVVQYSQSNEWANLLAKYGQGIVDTVNNQAIRGTASGWSPLRTASNIRQLAENLPASQANTLMRTLQLTSYRDGTAIQQTANQDIASQVIRIAALDDRTCLSCIALHGKVIWDSETDAGTPVPRVDDHWNGRCTSVVQVKGRTLNVQTGVDWFNNLPESRQQQQASFANSPGKWEAFQKGDVTLQDFVHQHQDDTFGQMVTESTLNGALKGSA